MARLAATRRLRFLGSLVLGIVIIASALVWKQADADAKAESISNYELAFASPDGWTKEQHSPQSLFLYRHPKTHLSLRGASSQIVAEFNPTPELDRDGLTKQFAEVTTDNLGWKADILDTVDFSGGSYRLIRRETVDRTIVTGIAVRGNTTVLITLTGIGDAKAHVDAEMPVFRSYLASMSFTKADMH